MVRDLRDPEAIGRCLDSNNRLHGWTIREMADYIDCSVIDVPLVPEVDGVYVGTLKRYGDQRARHIG